jgi:streptogramin lyase
VSLGSPSKNWGLIMRHSLASVGLYAAATRLFAMIVVLGPGVLGASSSSAQTFSEFLIPTANSMTIGITMGPDGALWFTEDRGNKIGRITTAGSITEFPIPTAGSSSALITPGLDGALWFTEEVGKIGRITTAGVITEFPIPTSGSQPEGITSAPDGALWFTESLTSKMVPSGTW